MTDYVDPNIALVAGKYILDLQALRNDLEAIKNTYNTVTIFTPCETQQDFQIRNAVPMYVEQNCNDLGYLVYYLDDPTCITILLNPPST